MLKKLLFPSWIVFAICLFLYSFTQVDLSLTLSQASIYQTVEKYFQHIGYFQRPLSSNLYLLLLFFGFSLFLKTLYLVKKGEITRKKFWLITTTVSLILFFSYNAFSYDLFNYIFDAKIVTHYYENPYFRKALDYPMDPMLSFMRWTHRTYPYGPSWLGFTVPLSYLGFNIFLLTFYLFKFLSLAAYFGTVYFIEKILREIDEKNSLFGTAFFALNPIVLIESLVSSHNDIVMMFFAMAAFYFLVKKQWLSSLLLLLTSGGIKFATFFLLPVYFVFLSRKRFFKDGLKVETAVYISLVLMVATIVIATVRTNFQPWYLLFALPFAALSAKKIIVFIPSVILSISSLLNYYPFIREGNWNPPIPYYLNVINISGVFLSLALVGAVFVKRKQ